jgi:hypothetical protein
VANLRRPRDALHEWVGGDPRQRSGAQQLRGRVELQQDAQPHLYVNPTQVCVNPTQVCVNPTQVCVNPTQAYVNPTQVYVNPYPGVC